MGNERRLKFWKDKWCGDEPLSVSFPSLFALATLKEAWVADLWSHFIGAGVWIPRFSRHLNDREIEEVECFFARLVGKGADEGGEDKVCWLEEKSGTFFVKSLYSSLEEGRFVPFLSSIVWNAWVSPKVSFFAWEVA